MLHRPGGTPNQRRSLKPLKQDGGAHGGKAGDGRSSAARGGRSHVVRRLGAAILYGAGRGGGHIVGGRGPEAEQLGESGAGGPRPRDASERGVGVFWGFVEEAGTGNCKEPPPRASCLGISPFLRLFTSGGSAGERGPAPPSLPPPCVS